MAAQNPTKAIPPSKRLARLILCEDVRMELGGKPSFLGVVLGDRFTIMPPPGVAMPNGVVNAIDSLSFALTVFDGEGAFSPDVSVVAPSGRQVFVANLNESTIVPGTPALLVVKARPFVVPEFGKYVARFVFGKAKLDFPFTIDKAVPGSS